MVSRRTRRAGLAGVLLALLAWTAADAAVTARVDRATVDLNESFTLEIVVDTTTSAEPDLSVLDENFYVGQVSTLSNTSIFNGEIRRSLSWNVTLMPKITGAQVIPPIPLGSEQSNPVEIVVNEPANAPPGEADVFVTSEVDLDETYVQSQILYRIKVYRAVATRQPALREPTIAGAEVLIELAGDEKSYEAVLNGRAYNVVERVIAIYPQESGEITISPARFEARVLRDGRITGRKVFESEPHTINVLPIPAPPPDYPNAKWLPARDVRITEEWSQDPSELEAGEPVTRHVTLSALGQLETQLPAIEPPVVDGLNIYADKPELSRRLEDQGIRGVRKDQYAIIGTTGGEVELPDLEVPWWDIDNGEWRVARLQGRKLVVKGAPAAAEPPVEPAAAPDSAVDSPPAAEPAPAVVIDTFWQRAAELLAVAWLLTLAAWWWSSRSGPRGTKALRAPEAPPLHKRQARLLKTAREAAAAGDAAAVRSALLEWARLTWPEHAPLSIGGISARVSSPLAEELAKLSSASYGPGDHGWDGVALARALKAFRISQAPAAESGAEALPPLMPPAARREAVRHQDRVARGL